MLKMYGLNSQESLKKRQSRWSRDTDESLNFFPTPKSNIKKDSSESIIKIMNDDSSSYSFSPYDMSFSKKSTDNDNLEKTVLELKRDHEKLKKKIKKFSDITSRIDKLEKYRDISTLFVTLAEHDKDLRNLKNTITELSSIQKPEKNKKIFSNDFSDSSMFSSLTTIDIKESHIFVPFFIKEKYSSRDNITKLENNYMDLTVQILGKFSGAPIIFPFGKDKNLPFFKVKSLEMTFEDAKSLEGNSFGTFLKNTEGIYIIHFTELYHNNVSSNISDFTLPLTIKCKTFLEIE
jgi:hypothetical protein